MGEANDDGERILVTTKSWQPARTTEIRVSFGVDKHYDVRLQCNGDNIYDHADDGAKMYGAAVWFGGLTPPETDPSDDEQEVIAWRSFNEHELRALAKAFLSAAGKLRGMENASRKKLARPQ